MIAIKPTTAAPLDTEELPSSAQRSPYFSLLQIAGAVSIVAFHIGIPFSQAAWIVVELFFVMAGFNMAAACDREQSVAGYAWSRARRLLPEVGAVWCVALLFALLGYGSDGILWSIGTAPFFIQNLSRPLFEYSFPQDWVFAPLWFVSTLLQLQILLFALRRWWKRAKPATVILVVACGSLCFRLLFALCFGESARTMPDFGADALYCLPFSHLEAIVLGLMMGRGALVRIGRFLPGLALAIVGLGTLSVWLTNDSASPRSGGFEFPLRLNYLHVWGYTLLAFAAAALCAKDGPVAVAFEKFKRPPSLNQGLAGLASLTYGIYLFHGIIMATGVNGSAWLSRDHAPVLRLLLFVITMLESLLLAWAFGWLTQSAMPALWRVGLTAGRRWSGAPDGGTKGESPSLSPWS